jgi:hypothetical protein
LKRILDPFREEGTSLMYNYVLDSLTTA